MGTVWAQWAKNGPKTHRGGLSIGAMQLHRNLQNYLHLRGVSNPGNFGSDGWNRTTDLGVMNPTL